ncbi:hypothetical protein EXIGLDRAFT_729188 [Exidia glandulosa HHB12029]|uniref:Uncharacterized protein n=1 Tax=Exidia glandulosa HHB12029 TaxID=1314781 RepID=A0A166B5E6_EXIGL|nr:hypothetical protein EXIGLDRAFT_729188 [Exidia glandulosa HHB12029]
MDERQTLPPEIILLIAECAALCAAQDPLNMGWAASLCLVCRSFRSAVTPILYAHVVITEDNMEHLSFLAHKAPEVLLYTRSVTFHSIPILKHGAVEYFFGRLAHLRAFTGPNFLLDRICSVNEHLTIPTIFLTDAVTTSHFHYCLSGYAHSIMERATRLHIVIFLGEHHNEFSPVEVFLEYLIVDVLTDGEIGWVRTPGLLQHFSNALNRLGSLRRILFRPRCLSPGFTVERFYSAAEEWGERKRDSRIWIDDTVSPSWVDDDGTDVHETLHLQDAVVGDELWLRGRQLCPTSVPAPVANKQ